MADSNALTALRNEAKFQPNKYYTGPDTPEDAPALTKAVNRTIDEVLSWPTPVDPTKLRNQLKKLIRNVDGFATEDRDETYRYAIRIWRRAGFADETKLFNRSDDEILWPWERKAK